MSRRNLDPDKIIDYSVNYYAVLGLKKEELPQRKTTKQKQEYAELLDDAYRSRARYAHPDFGGSTEDFIRLVRAHTILSDPILTAVYESGGKKKFITVEDGSTMEVDWETLGDYRPNTMMDTIGHGLFLLLCERAKELDLVPSFQPSDPSHPYEWDFTIPDEGLRIKKLANGEEVTVPAPKISISIVLDEKDVLRLTNGENIDRALPFKIYVCIPRVSLTFMRDEPEYYDFHGQQVRMRGRVRATTYSDYNLLETTVLEEAREYLKSDTLTEDVRLFRTGDIQLAQKLREIATEQYNWVDTSHLRKLDADALKRVLRSKTFRVKKRPGAAEFLKDLPE
jgi:hypothetical protein